MYLTMGLAKAEGVELRVPQEGSAKSTSSLQGSVSGGGGVLQRLGVAKVNIRQENR